MRFGDASLTPVSECKTPPRCSISAFLAKSLGSRVMGCALLLATVVSGTNAQQAAESQGPAGVTPVSRAQTVPESLDEYRIGPGDQLSIKFFGKDQLLKEERVDMRGMINMPLIDEYIRAGCRTENELAEEIARVYRDRQLLRNPIVSVSVMDYQSQPVAVMGAVNSPGRFILHRRVSLLELLSFHAGGPSPKAGNRVQILSTTPTLSCEGPDAQDTSASPANPNGRDKIVTYDLNRLKEGFHDENPYVRPGDIINVPVAAEAIIMGNVSHPSALPLLEPTTLARAIVVVGGTLPNSKLDKIRITRQIPGSSTATTELLVDLKDKDKSKGEGFLLQGGDVVEVSTNTGLTGFLHFLYKTAVPLASSLPLRVIY